MGAIENGLLKIIEPDFKAGDRVTFTKAVNGSRKLSLFHGRVTESSCSHIVVEVDECEKKHYFFTQKDQKTYNVLKAG